ncbi:MAG: ABC transporter ATP-binding protein [Candidatus Hydrogenedentota bacterium]
MTDSTTLFTVNDVSKAYSDTPVLQQVTMTVNAGDSIAIMGPSGCGKSTLLNLIGTLDQPDSGTIEFDGHNLANLNESEVAHFRNNSIGFIFQSHHLLPQCTVIENILLPTLVTGITSQSRERAEKLLDRVGLADRSDELPGKLSGGERQRIAVVRALINQPQLLLADEPTGSLSRSGADSLTSLILELNEEENMALIVVTHSLTVANRMDRVYQLDEGVLADYTGGEV